MQSREGLGLLGAGRGEREQDLICLKDTSTGSEHKVCEQGAKTESLRKSVAISLSFWYAVTG